ncbi:hypothetical protein D3C87_1756240 [compost metagenome]
MDVRLSSVKQLAVGSIYIPAVVLMIAHGIYDRRAEGQAGPSSPPGLHVDVAG